MHDTQHKHMKINEYSVFYYPAINTNYPVINTK